MTSDETPATNVDEGPGKLEAPEVAPHVSARLDGPSLQANLSAIATSQTGTLEAVGSAIGFVSADGDVAVTASATPLVYSKGNISIRQSYASAVLAGNDMDISQSAAPIIVGKKLDVTQGGGIVLLSGEATVNNGFVGVLLSPKATISEDSRVLMDTKAALIIAAALLGGFGIVALVMVLGVRRVMSWRPQISLPQIPNLAEFAKNPKLAELEERLHRFRGAA